MRGRRGGFTLVELIIVVSIIATISAIAIPNLMSARLNANETCAIATLRVLSSAQAQFQASAKCDIDNNGTGEFGLFREMSGASGVRLTSLADSVGTVMSPPVLSGAFRAISAQGEVSRSGYRFRMILPGAMGAGVPETGAGALSAPLDPTLCESSWCSYAWPSTYAHTGNRTFFINQTGDIVATDIPTYTGTGRFAANPGAAFSATSGLTVTSITGQVAVGTVGRDGHRWRPVN